MMLLLHSVAVVGIFLLAFCCCERWIGGISRRCGLLFVLSMAWALGVGLRGVVGLWFYRLDRPVTEAIVLTGAIGFLGLVLFFRRVRKTGLSFPRFSGGLDAREKAVGLLLLAGVSLYAWCAVVPWFEWDEMVHYGKEAKEYALGLTFSMRSSNIFGHMYLFGSKLVEPLTAQSMYVSQDTWLSRGLRLANIVFCLLGVFAFLRFAGVRRFWALTGIASILFLMDLQKGGVSLKVDSILMVFEFSAVLCLLLALLSPDKRPVLALLAVAFSGLAMATRVSGIYICFFATIVAVFTGFTMRRSGPQKIAYFLLILGILSVCGIGYAMNIRDFGNPFYPLSSPWPFHHGTYAHRLEDWKNTFNINQFPPVLNQIYLLFHLALGLGVIGHKLGLFFLPGTNYIFNNVRWVTPVLLTIFIVPFFWRGRPVVKVLSLLFVGWFTLWSLGAHYTRLFMAGSGACILLAVVIAGLERDSLTVFQKRCQRCVQFLLIASLGIFFLLHIREATGYPHDWHSLFSRRARYEAALNRFNGKKDYGFVIESLPTFEEARAISGLLKKRRSPIIEAEATRAMHIYFDAGFFTESVGPDGQFTMHDAADCHLGWHRPSSLNAGRNEALIAKTFPDILFDNGRFFVRCRGGAE